MPRPKIYGPDHFKFTTNRTKNGAVYVIAYRNEWDKEKKSSRIAQRIYVGKLDEDTARVTLGPKYLALHPELEGKELYYEDHNLVERNEEEEEFSEYDDGDVYEESCLYEDIEALPGWVSWNTAVENGILSNLEEVFGKLTARDLLRLAVYVYLSRGWSIKDFNYWQPSNWLPYSSELTSGRINENLSSISFKQNKEYFKRRISRIRAIHKELTENNLLDKSAKTFLVLDAIADSYSDTIVDDFYGSIKLSDEPKLLNYILGVDYVTGTA